MNYKNCLLRIAALFFFSFCLLNTAYAKGKFVPSKGKILYFAGQNVDSIKDYVQTVGIIPAGLMTYTSVQNADSLDQPMDNGAGINHAQYLLDKYPDTALQIGLYMVDALDGIIAGDFDDNIDFIGSFIKHSSRPVFLRIGYEFDGPHNHYNPAKYVKAYRRIVDRFRKNGVNNVAYVWHSYASKLSRPLEDWYPGDEYVDWFGISFFDQKDEKMFMPMLRLARLHHKPVMVAEASPARTSTSLGEACWNGWFKRYFDFINKNNIKCFCYININWDNFPLFKELNWGDARLGTNEFIRQKWVEEIRKDKYLMSSGQLFNQIGFTPSESSPPKSEK